MADYIEPQNERIVALIDMDCFYVQVKMRERPELRGKPVVLLTTDNPVASTVIALSYEAKALGMKRWMTRARCLELCRDVNMVVMPHKHEKHDLAMFRSASSEVMNVLLQHSDIVERASVDEAYIDITANVRDMIWLSNSELKDKLKHTYIAGFEGSQEKQIDSWLEHLSTNPHQSYDYMLSLGAVYVNTIRAQILKDTQFTCSAGIGANKIVAKLAAGTHKPDSQTIIAPIHIPLFYEQTPINKLKNLGGNLGSQVQEKLGVEVASELIKFSQFQLNSYFGEKHGLWIFNIARGHDGEPVKIRILSKQVASVKEFYKGIKSATELDKWTIYLSEELEDRLAYEKSDNKRIPTQLTVSLKLKNAGSCSLQVALTISDFHTIKMVVTNFLKKKVLKNGDMCTDTVMMMSLSAGKFVPAPKKANILTILKNKDHNKMNAKKQEQPANKENSSTSECLHSVELQENLDTEPTEPTLDAMPADTHDSGTDQVVTEPPDTRDSGTDQVVTEPPDSRNSGTDQVATEPRGSRNVKCPTCNRAVLESRLPVHLDFHTARDLQRQFDKKFQEGHTASPKRAFPPSSKLHGAKKQKFSPIQSKNISSFFKKK